MSKNPILPAISLEGVSKGFGAFQVLEPLDLAVYPGESVAIVGPSGAGKTTLFQLLVGSLAPDRGQVWLHNRDVTSMRPGRDRSRLVGMIAQNYDLVPQLSTLHNVLAGRLGEWGFWKSLFSLLSPADQSIGLAALTRVGLSDKSSLRVARLSGGEQQRVAIARVLVQDPSVVLADEPVSSLDPARALEVIQLLLGVTREAQKTLVASVHTVELARTYFSRVIGLRNGAVVFDVANGKVSNKMLAGLYNLQGLRGTA